ncbi:MAG: Flp pilus assembly protein CpaB [Desulfuromonas sp.]|uniref:Flp pilus assembly protein CpaB n=1 Tax=Desulfuromonas sp. TaxID=892 RepID=UPI000CB8205F|nr:Flp pilus assembly protein CpaB [Desulfuromonas sp.]PLX86248.1 MAG: Flp pilus assembly protein CpaB [Desulfuromonas sp.]
MKKYGTVIALGVAVLFGVVAVILANRWLEARTLEERVVVKESVPLTKVVIATQDLNIGSRLTMDKLALADWPKSSLPAGAFENLEEVEGRITVSKMIAGNPVMASGLAGEGAGVGLVAVITHGKRAMSIKVDEVVGVGGFILPHTFVDVISVKKNGSSSNQTAKTILQKIEVLAIAQETFAEDGKAQIVRTVTLEVDPKQAERLALATNEGKVHLVLRNPIEEIAEAPKPKPVAKKRVARVVAPKALKPRVYVPKPSPHAVEVIRGTKGMEKIEFKNVNSEEKL